MMVCVLQGPKEIMEDNRIKMTVEPDAVYLNCKSAVKGDEGRYSITLKNIKGTDTANVNVKVVG